MKPRLLDEVRNVARMRHLSLRTEQAYLQWIRRYVSFHHKRHPREMGETEKKQPLRHLQMVKVLHEQDLAAGYGEVYLPYALARKYPNAPKEWGVAVYLSGRKPMDR